MVNTFASWEEHDQALKDARSDAAADRIRAARQWNRGEFLEFLEGYTECAFWADAPELDREKRTVEALRAMHDACLTFVKANMDDLFGLPGRGPAECGHDFWLSRNGHGTGFWDRNLGAVGDRLHAAAKACGEAHLELGDDNNVHYLSDKPIERG